MDETLFFYSLSARFKPWYHSWPYVPESTTINLLVWLLICCVLIELVIELTKTKNELLNPYTGLFWYMATMSFP